MSFKYVYLLYLADLLDIGKTGVEMLKQNYRHFHLPIDNIVLQHHTVKRLYSEHIGNIAWSRIDDYSKYLAFQKSLSEAVEIPLIVFEGQIWNHFEADVRQNFADTLSKAIEQGYTKEMLADTLKDQFNDLANRSSNYWQGLAEHTKTVEQYTR